MQFEFLLFVCFLKHFCLLNVFLYLVKGLKVNEIIFRTNQLYTKITCYFNKIRTAEYVIMELQNPILSHLLFFGKTYSIYLRSLFLVFRVLVFHSILLKPLGLLLKIKLINVTSMSI